MTFVQSFLRYCINKRASPGHKFPFTFLNFLFARIIYVPVKQMQRNHLFAFLCFSSMHGAFSAKLVTKTIKVLNNVFNKLLKLTCCAHSVVTSHFGRSIYTIQADSSGKTKLICFHCKR